MYAAARQTALGFLQRYRRKLAIAVLLPLAAIIIFSLLQPRPPARAQGQEVDLALMLAIDVSYSVNYREFVLQTKGLAQAFREPKIHAAIAKGQLGRIAVSVMQWSDETHQLMGVRWTIIDSAQSALQFADRLGKEPRRLAEGGTSIGAAMRYGAAALLTAPVITNRRVIDISADGRNNRGIRPSIIRDQLAAKGITINGLAILNEWPTLHKYFEQKVIGGPYHFVIIANDYEAYGKAIYRKLLREIVGPGIS